MIFKVESFSVELPTVDNSLVMGRIVEVGNLDLSDKPISGKPTDTGCPVELATVNNPLVVGRIAEVESTDTGFPVKTAAEDIVMTMRKEGRLEPIATLGKPFGTLCMKVLEVGIIIVNGQRTAAVVLTIGDD